jgi:hypothetical protein
LHAHEKSQHAKILKLAGKTSNLRAVAASPAPDWYVRRRLEYFEWARQIAKRLKGASEWLEGEFQQAAARPSASQHSPADDTECFFIVSLFTTL